MVRNIIAGLVWLLVLCTGSARAEPADLQAHCRMEFPEAMLHLQDSIRHFGYTVSRVQHVDKGLQQRGYDTAAYKVVFFGKPDEIDFIRQNYPILIPFIPLSITISEDNRGTLVSALRPSQLSNMIEDFKLQIFFRRWEQHMLQIMERYAACQQHA